MGDYRKPGSEEQFDENFAQIKPLMNETEAYYESSRCLFCYDAPCQTACPTDIDIPLFIRQIHSGDLTGSARTIYASNFLGNACGKVCPTEVLCEGACVYNLQDVKPIEIGRLQNYATIRAIQTKRSLIETGRPTGKRVAVIGAGPAGISCACQLRTYGHEVDIFEARALPSGLTIHGVAPYKITNEEVLQEVEYLQEQFGFRIHYNRAIRPGEELGRLEKEYDALFIGIGLGSTSSLNIPGEHLENSVGATELIEQVRLKHHGARVGQSVIVIGGGNTAMDAASASARLGAESVLLTYRRTKEQMRAYGFEFELARKVGATAMFNVTPLEILGDGKVEGVRFIRTDTGSGRVVPITGSEFTLQCDMVIRATGQSRQREFLGQIPDIQQDEKGRIMVDALSFQTGNPAYFAGGDAVNGGKEVVNAAAEGKKAAIGIHHYLTK